MPKLGIYLLLLIPFTLVEAATGEASILQLKTMKVLTGHTGYVDNIAFIPGSDHLLVSASSRDRSVRLWDLRKKQQLDAIQYTSNANRPYDFVISPDGKKLSVLRGSSIRTYPVTQRGFGEEQVYWGTTRSNHGGLAISRRGTFYVITSRSDPVRVSNVNRHKEHQPYLGTENYGAVDFASDTVFAAAEREGNTLALWDIKALEGFGAKQAYKIANITPTLGTWALRFSNDATQLALGHVGGEVTLWQVNGITARQRFTFRLPESAFSPVFSPKGQLLAVSCQTGSIYIWETDTGRQVKSYAGSVGSLLSLDMNSRGTRMAAGALDGKIVVWEK